VGGGVVGRVVAFQDLTPIRRMEEVVRRSEHLAGVGRLAAGIAHELRNPLASISGSVELLRGAAQIGPEEKRLMGIVGREVGRLADLVGGDARPVEVGERGEALHAPGEEITLETVRRAAGVGARRAREAVSASARWTSKGADAAALTAADGVSPAAVAGISGRRPAAS
jgi:signal transduction histidine kinase